MTSEHTNASRASRRTTTDGDDRPRTGRSHVVVGCAALFVLATAVGLPSIGSWCSLTPDSIDYMTTARSLARTGAFPATFLMRPPAFPAIIAPLFAFADAPFLAMRVLFTLCWAASSALTFLLYRHELGSRLAWVAGALVAVNSVLLVQTTVVLSEIVFLPVLLAVLLLMTRWRRRGPASRIEIVSGGLLISAAVLLRSMGLVLIPILTAILLADRRGPRGARFRQTAVFLICAAAPLVAWHARQSAYPSGRGYARMWTVAREAEQTTATGVRLQWERFGVFAPLRLASMKAAVLPSRLAWRAFQSPFDRITTWLVGGILVGIALVRALSLGCPVHIYFLLTLLMLALWPWDEGVRLIAPLIPILLGSALWAGRELWIRANRRTWIRAGLAVTLALFLAAQCGELVLAHSRLRLTERKARDRLVKMQQLADWLRNRALPNEAIACITPNGHNSKTIVCGGAYLSRTTVRRYIDIHANSSVGFQPTESDCVMVHDSLAAQYEKVHGWPAGASVLDFEVFFPQDRQPNHSPGDALAFH